MYVIEKEMNVFIICECAIVLNCLSSKLRNEIKLANNWPRVNLR